MGGLVSRYSVPADNPLSQKMNQIKPAEIMELLEYHQSYYPDSSTLTYTQFDDIFSPYLNDTTDSYELLTSPAGEVDWYESLAISILSANAHGKWKILMLYSIFDFDQSGQLDSKELCNTLSVCSRALSRLAGGDLPRLSDITAAASAMFEEIDTDKSGYLDQNEVVQWTANNKEIQNLMCSLAHQQGIELALIRYREMLEQYLSDPLKEGPEEVLGRLKSLPEMKNMNEEEWTCITRLFVKKDGSIHTFDYTEAIKNLVAFIVADYSQNGVLNKPELKVLLSFKKDREVADYIVDEQMKLIDVNGQGTVNLTEWLSYLYIEDGFRIKSSFDAIDTDLSGKLSVDEIGNLLKEALPEGDAEFLHGLAQDILVLNDRKEVNWIAFKGIWPEIKHKIDIAKGLI